MRAREAAKGGQVITAYKTDGGYCLLTSDGVTIPLSPNEAHAIYVLVAAELARLRRQESEEADA